MSATEDLFKRVLVFIGDLTRMEIRLNALRKEAERLGIELEDLPESEKTIVRLKDEAMNLHKHVDDKLDGAEK